MFSLAKLCTYHRCRCQFPVASRRLRTFHLAGDGHRDSGSARRRYHHGIRSMHGPAGGRGRDRGRGQADHAMGRAVRPAGVARIRRCSASSRVDWMRAARRLGARSGEAAIRRLRDRRSLRRRKQDRHVPDAGGDGPGIACCQTAVSDGGRDARESGRAVGRGIDLFDCVVPSRHGRTGWLFTFSDGV